MRKIFLILGTLTVAMIAVVLAFSTVTKAQDEQEQ